MRGELKAEINRQKSDISSFKLYGKYLICKGEIYNMQMPEKIKKGPLKKEYEYICGNIIDFKWKDEEEYLIDVGGAVKSTDIKPNGLIVFKYNGCNVVMAANCEYIDKNNYLVCKYDRTDVYDDRCGLQSEIQNKIVSYLRYRK